MNHLDTFSGIGGWALAARWMGWTTLAFVEKEKFCHRVLNKNFPGTPIHDDIFTFSGKPFRGRVDILTGSTPCQPFSQAGKRAGSNDERHLFPEFLRVVAEVEPRWIVIENVYGLLSIESGQVFEEYHAQLESKGYSVQTVCVPASALNAPHRRDRLWIVARRNRDGVAARNTTSNPSDTVRQISQGTDTLAGRGVSATHPLNSEHRANRRPQSETNGIQSIGGAKGLSGRVSGAVSDVADPDISGRIGRQEQSEIRERQSNQGCGNDRPLSEFAVDYCSDVADSDKSGLQGQPKRAEPRLRSRRERDNDAGNAEGTDGRSDNGFGANEFRGTDSRWQDKWTDVAARTCVRGVDDGISAELDIIGSRDNRVSRLKSLGNAIVPSIAFELFRAIEEVEKKSAALGA